MRYRALPGLLAGFVGSALAIASPTGTVPDRSLRVVIIRHAEKPEVGDHLSCQGENRALQLPVVLYRKFKRPDRVYVPSAVTRQSTSHVRMFETIVPFAVKYDLSVNSEFPVHAYVDLAGRVLKETGTVLLVWEHRAIPALASQLGVNKPPKWKSADFDSIWIITFAGGKASLSIDREAIVPEVECRF